MSKRLSDSSDASVMLKLSIAIWKPAALNALSWGPAYSLALSSTDSVSSSMMLSLLRPRGASTASQSAGVVLLLRSWVDEVLMLTQKSGLPAWRNCLTCCATSRNTQSPISTMAPLSSAKGMNSIGMICPRPSWFQRSSASARAIWPVLRSTMGW